METQQTAEQTFQEVQHRAEGIKKGATEYFPEAASHNDYARQGDIFITKQDKLPTAVVPAKSQAQLAPGTTQGSRHILDSTQGVEFYKHKAPTALDGPILKTTEQRTVTHPEHGNIVLPPGVYTIHYQRAFAEELRRVLD